MTRPSRGSLVPDRVALAEIELYGELMIAASAVSDERLSPDRIDEVLRAAPGPGELEDFAPRWPYRQRRPAPGS